jgi:hypothetical protein
MMNIIKKFLLELNDGDMDRFVTPAQLQHWKRVMGDRPIPKSQEEMNSLRRELAVRPSILGRIKSFVDFIRPDPVSQPRKGEDRRSGEGVNRRFGERRVSAGTQLLLPGFERRKGEDRRQKD